MSNALRKLPHAALITKLTACWKCHALRIPLKQFVSLNFNALDFPNLRLTRFRKLANHLRFKTRIDSNFVAFHAILKPVNFDNSFSENSKRKQNFQSDFAPNWLTSRNPKTQLRQLIKTCAGKQCWFAEKPERIADGRKNKQQTIDFYCFKLTLIRRHIVVFHPSIVQSFSY